jgi:gliding motility-associated-like protein
MNAVAPVISGETGHWTVLDPNTGRFANESDNKSEVWNLSTGENYFLWTISNGLCNLDDSVKIEILADMIPQGFSPNGDAWNNTFIIEGLNLSDQQIAELTILNGAGTLVFSTSNRDGQVWTDWDGRNNKGLDMPEGTYYYLLNITTKEMQVIKKSGFIVLKRY